MIVHVMMIVRVMENLGALRVPFTGGNRMKNRMHKIACGSGTVAGDNLAAEKFSMWPTIQLLLAICVQTAATDCSAAASQHGNATDYILTATDGWPIHVTYYESSKGKESPVVVLLTAANGDTKSAVTRHVWKEMATYLQKSDFAVLAVDLRNNSGRVCTRGG